MQKLTKKEYIEDLKAGSIFVCATHGVPLEEVVKAVDTAPQCKLPVCYNYTAVKVKSNHLEFIKDGGGHSRRDFNGSNEYYTNKQILYHVNRQDDHVTIFVNR